MWGKLHLGEEGLVTSWAKERARALTTKLLGKKVVCEFGAVKAS